MTAPKVPSATVAEAATAPKMRFLYPLAAVCLAIVFLTPSGGQAQTASAAEQKQTNTFKALGSTLSKANPVISPFGGKTAKKAAEVQAAATVAGAVADALTQPAAQPVQSTPPAGGTPKLRPDQKYLVELAIAGVEPAQRPFIYEQMAKTYAGYNEAQTAQMIAALEANASAEQKAIAVKASRNDGPVEGTLSAADFEFNRAQYEPVIRKHWEAQKKFDDFVNAKLAAYCPSRDAVARWGSAWRYELVTFKTPHRTASDRADIDVQVMGSAYAPQDGRYTFDFSKVRYTFDERATEAAIKEGCAAYAAKGREFLAKLDPMIARQDWNGAFKLEQASMAPVNPIREKLDARLAELSPGAGYPVMMALQNGRKAK
jgi:hypothetical protein